MKKLLFSLAILSFLSSCTHPSEPETTDSRPLGYFPAEDYFLSRLYPDETLDVDAYTRALRQAQYRLEARNSFIGFDEEWEVKGPGNLGARINTIAVHPENEDIIFAGFARGGVWRTTNGGQSWEPVFDSQVFLAVGDIEFDPSNPDVIYVGTGDPNISAHPGIGNGIYKSEDGGDTWAYLGLDEQRIISRVLVNPANPDVIYAGAMGIPFVRNSQRGLYRSTNGGESWEQVLFISDQAGVIDLVMHPENPNVLYAAGWDRIRNNTESIITGEGAVIYKSEDGGDSWELLDNGLPSEAIGRIGLAVSPANPELVFAMYVGTDSQLENVYLSTDAGQSWSALLDEDGLNGLPSDILGGFGWYFGKIRVNPNDPNDLFLLGVDLWRSRDGGQNWDRASPIWFTYDVHADKHDLVFTPSGALLLATDGGLYRSINDAESWEDIESIPATQYYRVAYNPHEPEWAYGGAQDNGTSGGPELNFEWPRIYGGDGFQAAFHPDFPGVMYAETQNGGIVVTRDGGISWQLGTQGIDLTDRRDWNMPYIISPHNPDVMYTGTFRAYKSTAGIFPMWEPISEDLTDGLVLHPRYHAITTLDESPLVEGVLYVGTVDANLWRSDDGGSSWIDVKQGLPERYITSVKASPDFEDYVYVSHSGYKDNDFIPHILRSKDRGQNWEDISADLPELAVNDLYVLPGHRDSVLFVATDAGVYGTMNSGISWERLGANMPYVQVYDLEYNPVFNELIAGTFARSILTYPLDSLFVMPPVVSADGPAIRQESFIKAFPSPATSQVTIQFYNIEPGKPYRLALIGQQGVVIRQWQGNGSGMVEESLDVGALPAGLYTVKVKMGPTLRSVRFVKY